MLIFNKKLTSQQKMDLMQLQAMFYKHDHALPCLYPDILDKPRAFDSHFLYYAEDVLVGFLSFYLFLER